MEIVFYIESKIKNNYPIKVKFVNGYFIIESRLNSL